MADQAGSALAHRAQVRATLIGAIAVLMWSLLAPLTVASKGIPPFQLLAMTFAAAFGFGSIWIVAAYGARDYATRLRQPRGALLLTLCGLFGYHALYFIALNNAPPAEASLINYLWPLLIVLLSAPLARERLHALQIVGALLGFAGTALLIMGGPVIPGADPTWGYLAAFGCALIWSVYSVSNWRYKEVPSTAIVGICGLVSLLGLVSHALFESGWVWPSGGQWLAVLAMGLGPVGLAFLVWDYGTKNGRLPVLGVISYAAPLLSTTLLVLLGWAPASLNLLLACIMIVGGAALASLTRTRPAV